MKGNEMDTYWQYRHLRTENHGVVTVAYHQEDRYTYKVCFGFCSPEDTFCKKRGRQEAVEERIDHSNRVFTLYRPEGYPLDHTFVDFLDYFYNKSAFKTNRNQYQFENEMHWPRWLPMFVAKWRYEINRPPGSFSNWLRANEIELTDKQRRFLYVYS
jgi:hypothetical protein